jgi:hypothetical protein
VAVALPLSLALYALLLLMLRAAVVLVIGGLLGAMAERVPAFGNRLAQAIQGIVNAITRLIDRALEPSLRKLAEWWREFAEAAGDAWREVTGFATDVAAKIEWLWSRGIPLAIQAVVRPIAQTASDAYGLATRLNTALNDAVRNINRQILTLATAVAVTIPRALDDIRNRVIPGVEGRVTAAINKVQAVVADNVLPRLGRIEFELPDIRGAIGTLGKLLDEVRNWAIPIASAFGAVAVIELLRHVRDCKPKSERLCRLDTDELEELLGLAIAIPTLAIIVTAIRSSASDVGDLLGELTDPLAR